MNKFISGIVTFSLRNRFFIFFMTALVIIAGIWSYIKTPLEAFPDVTNTQIIIVTQWNGRSAEEVERFVTVPIEVAMNSVQKKSTLRSISMFGLSVTKIIFDDDVEDFFARQQVNNLLRNVKLPSGDTAVIAKGKHLVYAIAHCMDCHSLTNSDSLLNLDKDVPLSGSVAFKLPVGTIYSANITSDPVYGIGRYDDGQIARVLRYGVHPDGTAVYDFMPFHNLSDEDLTAVISYLRTQKPIPLKKQENQLNAIGNMVKAFLVKPVGPSENIEQKIQKDSSVAYGKYLVMSVANCSGCHTKRSISGEFTGALLAGGNPMGGGHMPPNLTPDSSSRIFGWTEQIFINRFRMGKVYPDSEMPWNSFKRMDDIELKAIYKFLQTIKPVKTINSKS